MSPRCTDFKDPFRFLRGKCSQTKSTVNDANIDLLVDKRKPQWDECVDVCKVCQNSVKLALLKQKTTSKQTWQ